MEVVSSKSKPKLKLKFELASIKFLVAQLFSQFLVVSTKTKKADMFAVFSFGRSFSCHHKRQTNTRVIFFKL